MFEVFQPNKTLEFAIDGTHPQPKDASWNWIQSKLECPDIIEMQVFANRFCNMKLYQKVAALEKSFQYKFQALNLGSFFFWLYHMGKRVTSIFRFFQYVHIQDMKILANQCDGHCVMYAQLAGIYCIPSQNIAFFLLFERIFVAFFFNYICVCKFCFCFYNIIKR